MRNTRDYKEFAKREWHHIFSRGNGKMEVFRNGQDYAVFTHRIEAILGTSNGQGGQGRPLTTAQGTTNGRVRVRVTPLEKDSFTVAAYCLMPNHFHFLIRQNTDTPTSKLFLKLLTSYSMYFNRKYEHVGHVFQDRFRAVHIENETQLKHVSAYIHLNPQTARLVRSAHGWPYSSYAAYLGEKKVALCDTSPVLELFKNAREYRRFVEDAAQDIRERKDVTKLMLDI
jgi:putative transposase